ncbi:hypothetical protein SARC_06440 [Sphaeroforma arctica JP610]|uniref:Homeobox domain-containing protein n=1 Tax=Sphaeroforma arctica JP610 TaxID=667725 RepID=A0A0L0FZ31_9EUKA|nr:hypothetical protein SARC_06440 [Sphaeroforma arctica JP610]KNC81228.1 hypothetical protein SARC_06440 [Sphaeroforma arctica JP610]|eukprot:XP_014155130.1 hypothetical protein SARC_06440 [Sphaeroforma arctica JP610]
MVCDKCTTVALSTEGSEASPATLGVSLVKRNTQRRSTTRVLKAWLRDHHDKPYPTAREKDLLTQQTGLSLTQINYWFTNARRRYLPKMSLMTDGSSEIATRTSSSPDSIHMQNGEIVDGSSLVALAAPAEVGKSQALVPTSSLTALAAPGDITAKSESNTVTMANTTNALPGAPSASALPNPTITSTCTGTHTTTTATRANADTTAGQSGPNGEAKCKCCDKDTNELEKTMLDFIVKCNAMRSLDGRPGEAGSEDGKRKGGNRANPATTRILREWLNEHYQHPYPDADEKEELCKKTGMTIIQVNYWFVNARRRYLPKSSKTQSAINSHKAQTTEALMQQYRDALPGVSGVSASGTDRGQPLSTGQYDVHLASTTEGLISLSDTQAVNCVVTLPPHPVYPMSRGSAGLGLVGMGMGMGLDLNRVDAKGPETASPEALALNGTNASVSPPLGESSTGGTTSPGNNPNSAQPQPRVDVHALAPPPDHVQAQAQAHAQLRENAQSQENTQAHAASDSSGKRKLESMAESAGGDDTDEEDLSALVADEAHVHTLTDIHAQAHTTDTAKRHHSAGSYDGMIALSGGGHVGEESHAQNNARAQAQAQAQARAHAQAQHAHSLALAHASMQGLGMSALSHPGLGMGFNSGMDLNVLPLPVSADGMMGVSSLNANVASASDSALFGNSVRINHEMAEGAKVMSKGPTSKSGMSKKNSDSSKVLTTNLLKGWLREHSSNPYPDSAEKSQLREKTGMSMTQINYWFTNARRRYLPQIQNEKNRADEKTAGVEAS